MAGSKRRGIALEALESRALLSATPALGAAAEIAPVEAGNSPVSGQAINGIISGTNGTARGVVPVGGRGYVFPLVGVSVKGTFTTIGTPDNLTVQGTLTLAGRQGSLVIDIGAAGSQSAVGKGTTAYAQPFKVQAYVVSGTGRFANERASGTGYLELDSILGGVTVTTKNQQAENLGSYVLSLHLEPNSS